MLWLNFLHFYQPATAEKETADAAIIKSYSRIVKALLKNTGVKFTVNINGCLLEKINELGRTAIFDGLRKLIARGQIELTGTAAYHPILPLIPEAEAIKQIKLQEELLTKYFGEIKLRGFFLPEMAYSAATAKLIKKLGYEWIILDEISGAGKLKKMNCGQVYTDNESGLTVIFRERKLSQCYVPKEIITLLSKNKTAVTATDAELYGLHYTDLSGNFENLLKNNGLRTAAVSEFISQNPPREKINILSSSWESTAKELRAGKPYTLWQDKKNKIQMKIWELAKLAWETVERYDDDYQHLWAKRHLRQGLASCTFWWASGHDFKNLFGSLSWSPDEIERGVNELTKAIRSIENPMSREAKIKAEKSSLEIKKMIWNKHWKYYWKK
jgi:alpha-amylase/alpha-mannosidase (GH57 family)